MTTNSNVAWTKSNDGQKGHSLGFWRGCTHVSPACDHCYARSMSILHKWNFDEIQRTRKKTWDQPLVRSRETGEYNWKPGERVFVCPQGDFFHEDVPDEWRTEAWDTMRKRPLTWILLTKRPENIRPNTLMDGEQLNSIDRLPPDWGDEGWPNVILMTTAENQQMLDFRKPRLLSHPAACHGVSLEPLLGPIRRGLFDGITEPRQPIDPAVIGYRHPRTGKPVHRDLGWVIVGGESGPRHRPMDLDWLQSIHDQCKEAGVPLFVKQDSGPRPGQQGRIPDDLWNIKEFPILASRKDAETQRKDRPS